MTPHSLAFPDHPWEGHHFSLHVHRLSHWGGSLVNGTLRQRYGRFARRTDFAKLHRILERRGTPLTGPLRTSDDDIREYRRPSSGVTVLAERTPRRVDDLYAVISPCA